MWTAATSAGSIDDDSRGPDAGSPADDGAKENRGQRKPVAVRSDTKTFTTLVLHDVQHGVMSVLKIPKGREIYLTRFRELRTGARY